MADVAGENEADSGSGVPNTVAEGSGTPEEDLERNDSDRVTGNKLTSNTRTNKLLRLFYIIRYYNFFPTDLFLSNHCYNFIS